MSFRFYSRSIVLILLTIVSCKKETKSTFDLVWEFEFTKPADGLSLVNTNPALLDSRILIAPDEQITLLNEKTGVVIWQFEIPNSAYISTEEFLVDASSVFIKEDQHQNLYSINLTTGNEEWRLNISPNEFFQHSNDAIDEQYLYLTGATGAIFRYTKTGELASQYEVFDYGVRDRARSIRIVDNQLVFSQFFRKDELNHDSGRILSIDKETEEVLWEYRTDRGGFIFEPILLEEGILYAGVTDGPGEFVALNAANGEVIWKTLGVIGQSYTLTDSMVLVNDGISLLALDKSTGEELWNTGLAFGGGDSGNNIAYLDGYVYHSHSSSLWILEGRTGEIVHQEPRSPDGSPFGLLTAGNGKVFIQSDYALYAYTAWE